MWQLYREESLLLHSGVVHLWLANLSDKENKLSVYKKILSTDELAHADKFLKEEHGIYYVISKAITRQILSRYLAILPEKIEFGVEKNGKPFVVGGDLQFNVSHSGDYLLVGVTKKNLIGVDIERVKKNLDHLALAKRFFTQKEYETLEMLSDEKQIAAFYRCWTRKEAFIKATGLGLSFGLANFGVDVSEKSESSCLLSVSDKSFSKNDWFLSSISCEKLSSSYFAAFAAHEKVNQIFYWCFSNELC